MRIASRSQKPSSGNERYTIGEIQTKWGTAGETVWLYEVTKIERSRTGERVGVFTYHRDAIWVKADNEEVQRLMKDYERYKSEVHQESKSHTYHLLEQKYGKK